MSKVLYQQNIDNIVDTYTEIQKDFWFQHLKMKVLIKGAIAYIRPYMGKIISMNRSVWDDLVAMQQAGQDLYLSAYSLKPGNWYMVDIERYWKQAAIKHRWLYKDTIGLYDALDDATSYVQKNQASSRMTGGREILAGLFMYTISTFLTVWGPGGSLDLLSSTESLRFHKKALRNMDDMKIILEKLAKGKGGIQGIVAHENPSNEFKRKVFPFLGAVETRFRLVSATGWQTTDRANP